MRKLIIVTLLVVCVSCGGNQVNDLSGCEELNLDRQISVSADGFPVVSKELISYYPECVNALASYFKLDDFHAATFEERRMYFGPEWEETFREEACVNRSWSRRSPSICGS